MNLAVCGLRHGHIYDLIRRCGSRPDAALLGAWEEDADALRAAREALPGLPFYETWESILTDSRVDIVAVGDYYGIRGQRIIQALAAGKHVISDKPVCTRLDELDEIERLCGERGLKLSCLLDLRYDPALRTAQRLVSSGQLGEIHDIAFTGQHPLSWGSRPGWYFEPGKHGGTFNDIAIHGLDAVRMIAGLRLEKVLCARGWNAFAREAHDFRDCAQAMAKLNNGAGLMLDVSYAAPDPCGYALPTYWRFTFWGERGFLEARLGDGYVTLALAGDKATRRVEAEPVFGDALSDLLAEIEGKEVLFDTRSTLAAARDALALQAAADSMGKEGSR